MEGGNAPPAGSRGLFPFPRAASSLSPARTDILRFGHLFPLRAQLSFPRARLFPPRAPLSLRFLSPARASALARRPPGRPIAPRRRLPTQGDDIRPKVVASPTPSFKNRPDAKSSPRRLLNNYAMEFAKYLGIRITNHDCHGFYQ